MNAIQGLKTLMSDIANAKDSLELKFSLTKTQLQKELDQRKKIIKLQEEDIIKRLVEKTAKNTEKGLKLTHSDRRLNLNGGSITRYPSVSLKLKNREVVGMENRQRQNLGNGQGQYLDNTQGQNMGNGDEEQRKANAEEALAQSVQQQQKSIGQILEALKGLNTFKQEVKQQLGNIKQTISPLAGSTGQTWRLLYALKKISSD